MDGKPLIGRGPERRLLDEWRHDVDSGRARTLLLRGDPGIGKSTLLATVAEPAGGATVARVVGVEVEARVAFSALTTLVRPLGAWVAELGAQRAEALQGALTASESATTAMAVGAAVLELLARASEAAPLLLLIDDAQWIDPASAAALVFALRRLDAERVGALVAVRAAEPSGFDGAGFEELELQGLDAASGIALLRTTGPVDDRVAKQCWSDVGGNPLALLEVGALLDDEQRSGSRPLDARVQLGDRLERAFVHRLDALPPDTRTALLVAALADRGDMGPIELAVIDLGVDVDAFAAAERADIVAIADGSIDFRHPLLRAAIPRAADAPERRRAHRALADALPDAADADRRAWHLAGAATGPHAIAADALADAAGRALRRGGALSAARTLERSARLTPDAARAIERLLAAAIMYWDASMVAYAMELLGEVMDRTDDQLVRADAASALGEARAWEHDVASGTQFLVDEAAVIEPLDPERAALMLIRATMLAQMGGDVPRALALAEHACRAAAGSGEVEIGARCLRAMALQHHGEPERAAEDLAVLDLVASLPLDDVSSDVRNDALALLQLVGYLQMVREQWDPARGTLDGVIAAARRLGQPGVLGMAGALRAEIDFRTGRWTEAEAEASADVELNAIRREPVAYFGHATLARIEAARGLAESCREHAAPAVATGSRIGMSMLEAWAASALGLLELGRGDARRAVEHLSRVWSDFQRAECRDPGPLWWQGDLVEALVATGAREDAERLVRELDAQAQATGRVWGEAVVARGRGLLATSGGDDDFARSAVLLETLGAPFERARSLLLHGESRVRNGNRAGATPLLDDALDTFQRLGATPWVARAHAALGDEGDDRASTALSQLTGAELRVAFAIAQGCTNRDAGEQLYLSTRTVDAHLRAIFRKLDIRSRTELALLVANSDQVAPARAG